MTAPVRADTDRRQVYVTIPPAALRGLLLHLTDPDEAFTIALAQAADAADQVNKPCGCGDPDDHYSPEQADTNLQDALDHAAGLLPPVVWELRAVDRYTGPAADLGYDILHAAATAAGHVDCDRCQASVLRTVAVQDIEVPGRFWCTTACLENAAEHAGVRT